jgi:hypothetical protein
MERIKRFMLEGYGGATSTVVMIAAVGQCWPGLARIPAKHSLRLQTTAERKVRRRFRWGP